MATTKSNRKPANNSALGLQDIREQASTIGSDFRELAKTAGKAAMDQMDPIEKYVREKPIKSVLMAAGVGALLGVIFLRR